MIDAQNIGVGIGLITASIFGGFAVYEAIKKKLSAKTTLKTYTLTTTDIKFLMKELRNSVIEESLLRYVHTLNDQMLNMERWAEKIKAEGEKEFNKLLDIAGVHEFPNYMTSFRSSLYGMVYMTVEDFRGRCKQNHFDELSEDDFKRYVTMTSETYSEKSITYFRATFSKYNCILHLEDVVNKLKMLSLEAWIDCLGKARKITMDKQIEIQEIEDNFESYILKNSLKINLKERETDKKEEVE